MLGKVEGRRRRGCQRMRWLEGITDLMDMHLSTLREMVMTRKPGVLQSWGCKESDTTERVNGTVSKLECFTHRSISENLASASVSNIINTKWKKGPSVKEAQCWISCLRVHLIEHLGS